jgi:hypothetical protein
MMLSLMIASLPASVKKRPESIEMRQQTLFYLRQPMERRATISQCSLTMAPQKVGLFQVLFKNVEQNRLSHRNQ